MSRLSDSPKITNELTAQLPALTFKGEVVVVEREDQIAQACEDLASYPIIGFDTETRPSFTAGVTYKVSLLQLSTPTKCYLFRLNKIPLAREIQRILESTDIVKVGADVAGDIRSLNELRYFRDRAFLDLQSIIWEWGIEEKSLRKMSALVLGCRISKAQRLSNWEAQSLTPQQQTYAATDAWVAIIIYDKLMQSEKLSAELIRQRAAEMTKRKEEAARKKAERRSEGRYRGWNKKEKSVKGESKL